MCTSTAQFVYGAVVDPFSLIITARKYAKHRSALIFLNFLRRHKEANTLNATPKDGKKGIADLPLEVITLIWQKTLEPTEHEEKCDCWIKISYPERCFCFEEKFNENFKCTCWGVDVCACYDKWEHCLFECEPMSGFEDFMESDKTRELNWQKALHEWPAKYKPKASGKNTPLMNRKYINQFLRDHNLRIVDSCGLPGQDTFCELFVLDPVIISAGGSSKMRLRPFALSTVSHNSMNPVKKAVNLDMTVLRDMIDVTPGFADDFCNVAARYDLRPTKDIREKSKKANSTSKKEGDAAVAGLGPVYEYQVGFRMITTSQNCVHHRDLDEYDSDMGYSDDDMMFF